jgi:hypothetical protein
VNACPRDGFRIHTYDLKKTPVRPYIPSTRPPPSRQVVGATLRAGATDAIVMGVSLVEDVWLAAPPGVTDILERADPSRSKSRAPFYPGSPIRDSFTHAGWRSPVLKAYTTRSDSA